jgi:hypothetical protein
MKQNREGKHDHNPFKYYNIKMNLKEMFMDWTG